MAAADRRRGTPRLHSSVRLTPGVYFFQARGFALQRAQVVELRAAYFGGTEHVDLVDDFRLQRENALHALSEADFADGEARLRSALAGDDDAFEGLDAFLVAFLDFHLDLDGVSRRKVREVGATALGKQFFDDLVCHDCVLPAGAEAPNLIGF